LKKEFFKNKADCSIDKEKPPDEQNQKNTGHECPGFYVGAAV
jgi:hypothetical protein